MYKKGILLLLALVLPALALAGDKNPLEIKLPFKEATIEYRLSGVENGIETLYIRNYGKETAKYHKTTTNMMGMAKISETVELVDPEWIYTFDMQSQTGKKAANPQKYLIEEYNKLSEEEKAQVIKNSKELSTGPMFAGMTATVERKAVKILGYDCDKMAFMGSTVYTIHEAGLPLKTESNMMGMTMLVEAKKIDEGSPPSQYFKHPDGITAVMDPDADAMARAMARETVAMLKDPDAVKKATSARPILPDSNQQELSPEEQQQMNEAMEALKNIFGN